MATDPNANVTAPIDGRFVTYRIVRWLAIVIAIAAAVKFIIFDSVLIRTDQMAPKLIDGDRTIVLRLLNVWPLSLCCPQFRKSPVIVNDPLLFRYAACLRIAAKSGDSVFVSRGNFHIINKPDMEFSALPKNEESLPPDYSPRDSMGLYVLPQKGESIALDSLSLRDFFFTVSLIRQENPKASFDIKPSLYINGDTAPSFVFTDFYLYKGPIDSVPKEHEFDWFFWDRAHDYLRQSLQGKDVELSFSLMQNGVRQFNYTFTQSCIFLLADDWQKGYDSRFFGPVTSTYVGGRIVCVVWSIGRTDEGNRFLRIGRLFKIIS